MELQTVIPPPLNPLPPGEGKFDRFASLQAPPFKAGLREAIWNRYIPFREAPPFRAGSFTFYETINIYLHESIFQILF